MTTANFGNFNSEFNRRLAAQMSKLINAQFKNFQIPASPATEAMARQFSELASNRQLNVRIREIVAASVPTLPKIHITMPQMELVNQFSTRYGQMLFEMTDVGSRFDLDTVQSVVQGVENGAVTLDEQAVAEQDPEILDAVDDELQTILEGNEQTFTPAQRLVLRRSLLALYLITMVCVFYVANTQLPPEFLDWFNSIISALEFAGPAQALIKWADSDDEDPH